MVALKLIEGLLTVRNGYNLEFIEGKGLPQRFTNRHIFVNQQNLHLTRHALAGLLRLT